MIQFKRAIGIGVYDGLTARVAARYSFDFVWLSSFSISASQGLPDSSIVDSSELASIVRVVTRNTPLPTVVDLDAGYGDPLKVRHVAYEMARSGSSAVCIEDNPTSKRSSLYRSERRELVSAEQHCARIEAAQLGVRESSLPCSVIARTEALVAGLGAEEALRRASIYVDAGASAVFVQSVDPTGQDLMQFLAGWNGRAPVFVAPTLQNHHSAEDFWGAGATHVIFANHGLRAALMAIDSVFASLARSRRISAVEGSISTVDDVANLTNALSALCSFHFIPSPPLAHPSDANLKAAENV
jgi:phosphoenolpyruvate phosphomutase